MQTQKQEDPGDQQGSGKVTNNSSIKTRTTEDLGEWGFSVTDNMSYAEG